MVLIVQWLSAQAQKFIKNNQTSQKSKLKYLA